jgi:UDP-N-acetylglucosamine--N-acetylmuramyl-(pentapeptide) pyrophosphoryl-undecaprenol N-acetylglucosamine transferase
MKNHNYEPVTYPINHISYPIPHKPIRIVVTGGGTGGHVVPLMTIVEALKKQNFEVLYIGSGVEIEKNAAKKAGIEYKKVLTGKLRRYFSWQNFIDPFKIFIGSKQSFWHLLFFKPKVIFAKGGYVTFPVVLAGWFLGIPIITHESDIMMGLANRWEVKFAKKICVGFPVENYKDIPLDKIVYTGNPIKSEFFSTHPSTPLNHKPIILVTGGSQGARFINQTIASLLNVLTKKYHIIHVAGKNDFEWLSKNRWPDYELYEFTDKMPEFMKMSSLIITRAGAQTLAEISYLGKPSILIPLPTSANNHQAINGKLYEKNNAAVVISEKGLTPESLASIIEHLMNDGKLLREIGNNAKKISNPDAAKAITNEIKKVIK